MECTTAPSQNAPPNLAVPDFAFKHETIKPKVITVEVIAKKTSTVPLEHLTRATQLWLNSLCKLPIQSGAAVNFLDHSADPFLNAHAEVVRFEEQPAGLSSIDTVNRNKNTTTISSSTTTSSSSLSRAFLPWEIEWQIHAYHLYHHQPFEEQLQDDEDDDNNEEEAVTAYTQLPLPHASLDGVWETLYYDTDLKHRLVSYASSALLFSDRGVNSCIISWNRTVLLHGPPGTGKTSLCKALAQKLAVRLKGRFEEARLIEINAHALFSRWFSESGKQVNRLFDRIKESVHQPQTLVFVLIDEVESLAAARSASSGEPTDAVRAVNALLTQLDTLKSFPNVMVLTTSNITGRIDVAFVDRADIRAYVGHPSHIARYEILKSCISELQKVGIIADKTPCLSYGQAAEWYHSLNSTTNSNVNKSSGGDGGYGAVHNAESAQTLLTGTKSSRGDMMVEEQQIQHTQHAQQGPQQQQVGGYVSRDGMSREMLLSAKLFDIACKAEGFSGRALRKLPFLAHARHIGHQGGTSSSCGSNSEDFMEALDRAVQCEKAERAAL